MPDRSVATVVVGLDVGLDVHHYDGTVAGDSMGPQLETSISSPDHIYAIARAMYIVCPIHCK